jgi:hypothetical protein
MMNNLNVNTRFFISICEEWAGIHIISFRVMLFRMPDPEKEVKCGHSGGINNQYSDSFAHYMDKLTTKPRFTRYWKQIFALLEGMVASNT